MTEEELKDKMLLADVAVKQRFRDFFAYWEKTVDAEPITKADVEKMIAALDNPEVTDNGQSV